VGAALAATGFSHDSFFIQAVFIASGLVLFPGWQKASRKSAKDEDYEQQTRNYRIGGSRDAARVFHFGVRRSPRFEADLRLRACH
jgi:hypothetical protein